MPKTNMTPQEEMFNFLKSKGLTHYLDYNDFKQRTTRPVVPLKSKEPPELPLPKDYEGLKRIGIDLTEIGNTQREKQEERKRKYNEWKDSMGEPEKSEYNSVFGENT